ncbi:uncharacterized protein LOC117789957 isoform X2 [Drosophila innubila]|uniref:uncharacterized protein LOC117789957 isoform X2 n=1 Tax=Drosophila innubila TaxID=198719 RepID=UPI00148C2353|nr:uncharacterized protein LOC117789957 isoform X2 [Drosophila innubila]
MPHNLKLSEIKTNLTNIIENLQHLESLSNALLNSSDVEQSLQLQQHTTTLLSQLEDLSCKQIKSVQVQRKRRRQRVKQKRKLQKRVNKADANYFKDTKVICEPALQQTEKHAEHITLKKLHDATKILQTFDLLERLYQARGGNNDDLGQKLAQMRTVWRRVKQESENETGAQVAGNLEKQWDQVIFGSSSAPLKEQRRGQKKQNIQEFLQRRTTVTPFLYSLQTRLGLLHM